MGVRLTSHWTAAAFTGLLSVLGWGWVKGWMNERMKENYFFNYQFYYKAETITTHIPQITVLFLPANEYSVFSLNCNILSCQISLVHDPDVPSALYRDKFSWVLSVSLKIILQFFRSPPNGLTQRQRLLLASGRYPVRIPKGTGYRDSFPLFYSDIEVIIGTNRFPPATPIYHLAIIPNRIQFLYNHSSSNTVLK
jgi:hypothetical protein